MIRDSSAPASAFLDAADGGQLRLYACCGGQGPSNLTALDELVQLSNTYKDTSTIHNLISQSSQLLESLAAIPHRSCFFGRGFPLRTWLDDPRSAPSPDELALSPYSFPINTLLSLINYAVTARNLGLDPTQLRDTLHGVVGHSQGVFAAAAIAYAGAGAGWPAFYDAALYALQLSFWTGLESHTAAPGSTLSAEEVSDCLEYNEGLPSHLLSVSGLKVERLANLVQRLGNIDDPLVLSLINGPRKGVVAGSPQALRTVCLAIRRIKASDGQDQSRIHFNKRRPHVDVQFLPVSAPYHSAHLEFVEPRVMDGMADVRITGDHMAIPLFSNVDGQVVNLQAHGAKDAVSTLVRSVTTEKVDWPATCRKMQGATHILSFGPGAVGNLVQDAIDGRGSHVLHLTGRSLPSSLSMLTGPRLSLPHGQDWGQKYRPRLCRDGNRFIQTKMTQLLGTPHIMVAGMTPTTCSPDFVAAIMQAGYHVEFACGGYHKRTEMEKALRHLASSIPAHRSITCNVIYASPKSLSWQIDLLRQLIAEGLPIDGLTVGAGIPSPEVVKDWIESLGLSHIWLKPGSVNAIDRVLEIARRYPNLPVGLQWTGGRAGGHHSCEDFHQPVLERYGRIRECENIILVAGSGFGGGQDTWPYLTGSWSHQFGAASMPFDGILLGSRMMVAREAKTSLAAKQLIVDTSGIEDGDTAAWTRSESEPVGGVISVTSEMGQPIHVLATRGMRLWHEFDRRFFSIRDPERLRTTLQHHRDHIITRLNKDFARPWFAMVDDHAVEIEDMSYSQVLHRLCELTYVHHQGRWIDPSYLTLVHAFLDLVSCRFGSTSQHSGDPSGIKEAFERAYGTQADQALYPDDVELLHSLFPRPGQKPVSFIPRLDASFETWFKKDSLWQSEDVDAVIEQDAQRVCIIQGPIAAKHSTVCDEPAGRILDGICEAHRRMADDRNGEHLEDGLAQLKRKSFNLPGVQVSQDGSTWRYHMVGPAIASPEAIVEQLVNDCDWAAAVLTSLHVSFDKTRVKNPIRDAFQPGIGDIVEVVYGGNGPREITLYTALPQEGDFKKGCAALELMQLDSGEVSVTLLGRARGDTLRPSLEFRMKMIEDGTGRLSPAIFRKDYLDSVRRMYTQLWIGSPDPRPSSVGVNSEFTGDRVKISRDEVQAFLAVARQAGPSKCRAWDAHGAVVPLDYTVVIAWTALTKPILLPSLDADPLQLLHQSISTRLVRGARPLHVGDVVSTSSRITERTITPTGQRIEVSAEILRQGQPVVQLQTAFVVQRRPLGPSLQQFRSHNEPDMAVHVKTPVELHVLASRKWLHLDGPASDLLGKTLIFRANSQNVYDFSGSPTSLQVSGSVSLLSDNASASSAGTKIGRVYLEDEDYQVNPVMDFLNRYGTPRVQRQGLQSPGWTGESTTSFNAPSQSSSYATVSKDTNPIHVCPLFARFAGRGEPVVHGMHLSATVRRILEWMVGDRDRSRFTSWTASFDGMVRAHDRLKMEIQHKAMEEGSMVIHVRVINKITDQQVMHAEATIEQAQTSYVFTGQGTQEKGMGMALYNGHKAARQVWDRAERHFESQYGFSLLHIVQNNPTSLTVNFGSRRGRQIRANYLTMKCGSKTDQAMLSGLTERSRSYTFNYPPGLLMSTQFAQPALAVMEMAEYAHLQSQGVVQASAPFAGHSLGEYSALGACSTFMPFESLLSLILYRGLKMQNALSRDEHGATGYGMVAVDPSRIHKEFDDCSLMDLVRLVGEATGSLLEIVNHNVQSRQYVCAGHLRSLWLMGHVCDDLHHSPSPTDPDIMKECIAHHTHKLSSIHNQTKLNRGRSTIPLSGVDIPFHSQMLRGHIDDYRQHLRRHLHVSDIKPEELVGRWIPNVVGRPFALDTDFVALVQEVTGSEPLRELLGRLEGATI